MQNKIIILLLFLGCFLVNCEKEILVKRIPVDSPEFIEFPEVNKVLYNSAEVRWVNDHPCTTLVQYWAFGETDTSRVSAGEYRQNHSVKIYNLKESTQYNFRVHCFDRYENFVLSGVDAFKTSLDYREFIALGWEKFMAFDYDSSGYYFLYYLRNEPENFNARLGAAWGFCKKDLADSADIYFDQCLMDSSRHDDAVSGKTLNLYKQSNFGKTLKYGEIIHNKALNYWANHFESYTPLDSAFYVFRYDSTFDNLDVALMLADSYYRTLNYDKARTVVSFLYPGIKIHQALPDSWKVNLVLYENYEEALGAVIDSLKGEYWQNSNYPQ
jgi:hypothetical protein